MDASLWSRRAGALTSGLGGLALLGWGFDLTFLRSFIPGTVAMNPSTALVFVLAGVALVMSKPALLTAAAAVTILVGLSRLAGDFGLIAFHPDGILFSSALAGNRIAPNTAINFVFAGVAMSLLNARRPFVRHLCEALAFVTALVGLVAIFGYAYRAPSFYGFGRWIPMALNTAVAFVALSIGIMMARAGMLVSALTSDGVGTRSARSLIPTVIVLGWLLGWLRLEGQRRGLFSIELGVAIMATISVGFTILSVGWASRWVNRIHAELVLTQRTLERLATLDPLTELPNRRLFVGQVMVEVSRSQRHRSPLSVALLDCDHFKSVNDTHGHSAGDEVLVRVATVLRRELRVSDLAARIGGEELCVLMPETSLGGARLVAERLRAAIAAEQFHGRDGAGYTVTCSIGVAELGAAPDEGASFLARADRAMYAAKAAGRNRVTEELLSLVVSPPPAAVQAL